MPTPDPGLGSADAPARDSAAAREAAAEREQLVERILAVLGRTYSGDVDRAVEALRTHFLALPDAELRALALRMGLTEPGEPEPDET